MRFYNALGAIHSVLQENPEVYVVNEGANALDLARNVIDMELPRHRLDTGTWGVMGIGMGYAIAAAVETGSPVVAIEGDSAFGFSGMEIETICRYRLPVTVVILNNGGVYRGDEVPATGSGSGADGAERAGSSRADRRGVRRQGISRHDTGRTAVGAGRGDRVGGPSIIDCELDPAAGVESGHLASLNPTSAADAAGRGQRRRVIPNRCASKNSSRASCRAHAVRARATGDPARSSWWPARSEP